MTPDPAPGGFAPGRRAELTRSFPAEDVIAFAHLGGDDNPLHTDPEYAATTRFGRCIVHGTFYTGLLGTVMGTRCPGPGTILISQQHHFLKPVFVGDTVTAVVEIADVDEASCNIGLSMHCTNQDGVVVLRGTAVSRIAR